MKLLMTMIFVLPALCLTGFSYAQEVLPAGEAPYLYYYSDVLNSYVIERADGTDSRLIAHNLMDEPAQMIGGAGWSPSGRWLAWSARELGGYGYHDGKGYAASIDGTRLDVLDRFLCISMMRWHPREDILLIGGKVDGACNLYLNGVPTYWLIDASTQTILASASIEIVHESPPEFYWFEDSIQFTDAHVLFDGYYHVTMYFDGRVEISPMTQAQYFDAQRGQREPGGIGLYEYGDDFRFSRSRGVTALEGSRLSLSFPPPINCCGAGHNVSWLWNDEGNWLLLGYELCYADCSGITRRVSVYQPTTGLYREISACGDAEVCVGWLPERVPVHELPQGQSSSVLPAPLYYTWGDSWADHRLYGYGISLGVTHALECNPTTGTRSQARSLQTYEIEYVLPFAEPCSVEQAEVSYPPQVVLAFSPDSRFYAITDDQLYTRLHDAITGEEIVTLNFEGIGLSFSADSRYLYTSGRFANAVWDIESLER